MDAFVGLPVQLDASNPDQATATLYLARGTYVLEVAGDGPFLVGLYHNPGGIDFTTPGIGARYGVTKMDAPRLYRATVEAGPFALHVVSGACTVRVRRWTILDNGRPEFRPKFLGGK